MLPPSQTQSIELTAKLFRGFGDPSRLAILEALRSGPLTVSEIVQATGLSQSNASNHLACLRDCGLVTAEQNWRHVTYFLSDDRVGDLLGLAESLLSDVARGIYECTRYSTKKENVNG
jgi:DNA-binding transcriptional ArsR family regulator